MVARPLTARATELKRGQAVGIITLFVGLLLGPFLIGWRHDATLDTEKRRAAPFPELSPRALGDVHTYETVDAWFADRLELRDLATRLGSWAQVHLLRRSPSAEVHLGDDGWLFPAVEGAGACEVESVTELVRTLGALSSLLKPVGVKVSFLSAPAKLLVEAKYVRGLERDLACLRSGSRELGDALVEGQLGPDTGRVFANVAEDSFFWPSDIHLAPRGRIVLARELVDYMKPGTWNADDVVRHGVETNVGDLSRLIALPTVDRAPDFNVVRRGTETKQVLNLPQGPDPLLAVKRFRTSGTARLIGGRVLIVHDSQVGRAIQEFAPWFADVTFVDARVFGDPRFDQGSLWKAIDLPSVDRLVLESGTAQQIDFAHLILTQIQGHLEGKTTDGGG